jgi:dihydroneopterin aldolase
MDKIILKGLTGECRIGFHEYEQDIIQKLVIDIEVSVRPMTDFEADQVGMLRMDYFVASNIVREILSCRRYNLIETVAEDVSAALLKTFDIESVETTVTKHPHDMPHVRSVSYVCVRTKS